MESGLRRTADLPLVKSWLLTTAPISLHSFDAGVSELKLDWALPLAVLLAWSDPGAARYIPVASRLLDAHNIERHAAGAAPLTWDAGLARAAERHAAQLARTGRFAHSLADQRIGQGENLWMGSRSGFSLERMVGAWISEKRLFRAGTFPNVSRGGSWQDVAHFTQVVWPATTRVGCSVQSSRQWDYLVCRYSAAGNILGQRVGLTRVAAR